jgi:superfamily II DNA or RNA helicase
VRLVERLEANGVVCLILRGGMGKKASAKVINLLEQAQPGTGLVLVATGSYLGEGFDCPPLDTLFLAFPLAFKGRVVQYVGRVMRPVDGKATVEVHDYVDVGVPVLERMHAKRVPVLENIGFAISSQQQLK